MKKWLFLLSLICSVSVFSQTTVRIGVGATVSSMTANLKYDILNDRIVTFNLSAATDYLQRKYFYLSSEFKYLRMGGDDRELYFLNSHGEQQKGLSDPESWNYLQLNTKFRARLPLGNYAIYVGVGPHINLLVGDRRFTNIPDVFDGQARRFFWGEIFEAGVTYIYNTVLFDLNASYQLNNCSIARTSLYTFDSRGVWGINVSAGYVF